MEKINSIIIGKTIWSKENLNVSAFNNGVPIREAKTEDEWINCFNTNQPAFCYYENDPLNGDKYGKLYNWFAVSDKNGLAPAGWKIPDEKLWIQLMDSIMIHEIEAFPRKIEMNSIGTSFVDNKCGGSRYIDGQFSAGEFWSEWWSLCKNHNDLTWYRCNGNKFFIELYGNKRLLGMGLSVRCIKK